MRSKFERRKIGRLQDVADGQEWDLEETTEYRNHRTTGEPLKDNWIATTCWLEVDGCKVWQDGDRYVIWWGNGERSECRLLPTITMATFH